MGSSLSGANLARPSHPVNNARGDGCDHAANGVFSAENDVASRQKPPSFIVRQQHFRADFDTHPHAPRARIGVVRTRVPLRPHHRAPRTRACARAPHAREGMRSMLRLPCGQAASMRPSARHSSPLHRSDRTRASPAPFIESTQRTLLQPPSSKGADARSAAGGCAVRRATPRRANPPRPLRDRRPLWQRGLGTRVPIIEAAQPTPLPCLSSKRPNARHTSPLHRSDPVHATPAPFIEGGRRAKRGGGMCFFAKRHHAAQIPHGHCVTVAPLVKGGLETRPACRCVSGRRRNAVLKPSPATSALHLRRAHFGCACDGPTACPQACPLASWFERNQALR